MKFCLFITSILFSFALLNAETQTVFWTLDSAINHAIKNSPDAAIAQSRIEQASAVAMQADSAFYPSLAVSLGYMQTNNPMNAFGAILNQGTFDNSLNFNNPGRIDAFNAGVYLKYHIYTGGSSFARSKAAENMGAAANYEREAIYNNLKIEVVRSFFAIIQSGKMKDAVNANIKALEESVKTSKILEESGKMLKSDRLNVEVRLLSAKQSLTSVEHQIQLSQKRFALILGLEKYDEILIDSKSVESLKLEEINLNDKKPRPEIMALESRIEAAENNIDAEFGMHFPRLSLYGGYQYDKGWVRTGDGDSWNAGVMLEIPLFDGMYVRGKVREAKAYERQAKAELRKLEMNLNYELEKAKLDYELSSQNVELSKKHLDQAEESARLSQERFNAGKLLSTEMTYSLSNLAEANVRYQTSKNSETIAYYELKRALGQNILQGSN